MRSLTRRAGQKLFIGEDIVVSVQRIRGGSVRLGFVVPPEVAVDREEIAEFKQRARVDANLRGALEQRMPAATPACTAQAPRAKRRVARP